MNLSTTNQDFNEDPDYAGMIRIETEQGQTPAKILPKDPPPPTGDRKLREWACCENCRTWFAAMSYKVKRGGSRFCSTACFGAFRIATGAQRGDRNGNWLGGVSKDNMRYRRRQIERHPVQEVARRLVRDAVRAGKLTRCPCEVCGAERSEGHHDDYSRPLDVRWLFRKHHTEHHNRERQAKAPARAVRAKPAPVEPVAADGSFQWRGMVRQG